jgi:hypothetical protein
MRTTSAVQTVTDTFSGASTLRGASQGTNDDTNGHCPSPRCGGRMYENTPDASPGRRAHVLAAPDWMNLANMIMKASV